MPKTFIIKKIKRAISFGQDSCLCSPSTTIRRHTYRRLNLLIHYLIIFLLLFSITYYYYSLPSLKTTKIHIQSSPPTRIMYVIRTSSKFYQNRLIYLLQTWILFVHKHVYFVTDQFLPNISHNQLILTKDKCGNEIHKTTNLCCKTAHDFILFHRYRMKYDWFCHFNDDQYVNIKNLGKYLSTLDSKHPYYIGRNSLSSTLKRTKEPFPHSFWFATLDGGVCLSKYLIDLLVPYTRNISQFINGCLRENYYDDIYLGFLISAYLNVTLTKDFRFHSHLEKKFYDDKKIFFQMFTKQITFTFRLPHYYPAFLPNLYKSQYDPYHIRTLHCLLYPYIFDCQTKIRQHIFNITE